MVDTTSTARLESRRRSLAEDNLHNQDQLFHDLVSARLQSGKSVDEVAACLGISVDVVHALEDGRVELTLADLRQYAYAVEALLSYRVRPNYVRELNSLTASLHAADSSSHWNSFSSKVLPSWKAAQVPVTAVRE